MQQHAANGHTERGAARFARNHAFTFELLEAKINDLVEGNGHTENWNRYVEIPGELIVRATTRISRQIRT